MKSLKLYNILKCEIKHDHFLRKYENTVALEQRSPVDRGVDVSVSSRGRCDIRTDK